MEININQYTLGYHEVIKVPYILSGYRVGDTTSDAILSLFRWHNETLNAWSLIIIPVVSIVMYITHLCSGTLSGTMVDYIILGLIPLHTILHAPFSVGNHLMRGLDELTHTY